MSSRENLIIAGLYLAKFDNAGLARLGFRSFVEAFNVLGCALGAKPASIKNYRDEFDPLYPNERKGWHKRPLRDHCREVLGKVGHLDIEPFAALVSKLFESRMPVQAEVEPLTGGAEEENSFAKRLVTGVAAEQYFRRVYPRLPQFEGFNAEDVTLTGCGYDFRLTRKQSADVLAVEVKGLSGMNGSIAMTTKEYQTAVALREGYFLFVVKNFQSVPCHEIYRDPTSEGLSFRRLERTVIQVSWTANL